VDRALGARVHSFCVQTVELEFEHLGTSEVVLHDPQSFIQVRNLALQLVQLLQLNLFD